MKNNAKNKEATDSDNKGAGLKITKEEGHKTSRVTPGERLYLTADKTTLVPEGHKDARTLYCTEIKSVPREEFESLKKR